MCVLSPNDQPVPTSYTAADLDFDLSLTVKRVEALAAAVKAAAFDSKGDACGGRDLNDLSLQFERAIKGFREGLCLALTGREPPQGNAPALVAAIREFAEERAIAAGARPRDPLATAMRRVDAVEAAQRSLVASAHASSADLARLDADHCYGKSAAPAPAPVRGDYQAGFGSLSAA